MNEDVSVYLKKIISSHSLILQAIPAEFIDQQVSDGIKNYLLTRLANPIIHPSTLAHLPYLEKRLQKLKNVVGHEGILYSLRRATDWDQYQEILIQIDISLWFIEHKLVMEIEPELPHRRGLTDLLLGYKGGRIYCEITSFESYIKYQSHMPSETKILSLVEQVFRNGSPISKDEAKTKLLIKHHAKKLHEKINKQLPPDEMGLLAIDILKAYTNSYNIKEAAKEVFPLKTQCAGIILWSGEGSATSEEEISWSDGNPNEMIINTHSRYEELASDFAREFNVPVSRIG